MANNYYLVNKRHFMTQFNQVIQVVKPVFVERYGATLSESIVKQTVQEFESLLFHIPYIGGAQNPYSSVLVQATWYVALYRVLKSYGKPVEEAGEMIYLATEAGLRPYPRVVTRMAGKMRFNRFSLAHLKEQAAESQKKAYADDWVFNVIEGDGKSFDFGVYYTECGICKYYHALGADELVRFVCLLDYPISAAMNTGLQRTQILADNGTLCDCHYKPGVNVPPAWPPDPQRP